MKGFRKIIYPFAPDQSGAVSVLYELGGIIVICDAGGCTGNICGFDEPRWTKKKSKIFSAGLRDMDAILGRDDMMIKKIIDVTKMMDASFIALIGTPVPATIGTDLDAIAKMIEKEINIFVLSINTNGASLYDDGISKAYLELFKKFGKDVSSEKNDVVGVIGASLLDATTSKEFDKMIRRIEDKENTKVWLYSIDTDNHPFEDIENAACASKNIVVAPSGIEAAKYLKERYGIEYEIYYPMPKESELFDDLNISKDILNHKRILIIHQQVYANSLREAIISCINDTKIDVATWFMMDDDIKLENDIHLYDEDQFISLADNNNYDVIIGDETFKKALKNFKGTYVNLPHFAVSGVW